MLLIPFEEEIGHGFVGNWVVAFDDVSWARRKSIRSVISLSGEVKFYEFIEENAGESFNCGSFRSCESQLSGC